MSDESTGAPGIADPTIEQVFEAFLAEQEQRLKPATFSRYRSTIQLLTICLDRYGYEDLTDAESELFDKLYNAEGDEHREFCQMFGPERIVAKLGSFLNYFMVSKVMAGPGLMKAAGTVTKKLSKWLAQKGYIGERSAAMGAEVGAEAARSLPAAERAARILVDAGDMFFDASDLADEDYMEFDHYTITKIEPGRIWLGSFLVEGGDTGPISVPRKATELLQEDWEISCALARVRGKWRLVEVANVYPH